MGRQVPQTPIHIERVFPPSFRPWLYRHALERGYFDAFLRAIVMKFLSVFRAVDWIDRKLFGLLAGERGPARNDGGKS